MEIKTKIEQLEEGKTYTAGYEDYLITENHSLSDIMRWLVNEIACGDIDELEFILQEMRNRKLRERVKK